MEDKWSMPRVYWSAFVGSGELLAGAKISLLAGGKVLLLFEASESEGASTPITRAEWSIFVGLEGELDELEVCRVVLCGRKGGLLKRWAEEREGISRSAQE